MIKFNEIKIGDFVLCEYEGKSWKGQVTHLNTNEKQVCIQTEVQEFWYDTEHLHPIALNDEAMQFLHFTKIENEDGTIKYMKGSFRLVLHKANDFSAFDMWYREDKRHNPDVHFVHQLQNQYLDMTKIHLTNLPM
jgi:hypothetical protein